MSIIYNKPILPIGKSSGVTKPENIKPIDKNINNVGGFNKIFEQELQKNESVKFSKHALERLQNRNIKLTEAQISKINDAVNKAAEKGVKEALVLMDNTAFIVNIKNKTVITAAMEENLKENVFTNIDGAIIT